MAAAPRLIGGSTVRRRVIHPFLFGVDPIRSPCARNDGPSAEWLRPDQMTQSWRYVTISSILIRLEFASPASVLGSILQFAVFDWTFHRRFRWASTSWRSSYRAPWPARSAGPTWARGR